MKSILAAAALFWLLVAWLALDDITTDPAPSHAVEYVVLTAAGIWFALGGVRVYRAGQRWLGFSALAILAAATVAVISLPEAPTAPSPSQVRVLVLAFAYFGALSAYELIALRRR